MAKATAKKSKKERAARRQTETAVATTPEVASLHLVGGTETASSTTINLPLTDYKWAPLRIKVNIKLTPEAEEKQELPPELPYPTRSDLAVEAAELIHQKKIKAKGGQKGKPFELTVDPTMLDQLYESWKNRPVSKNEVRTALQRAGVAITRMSEENKNRNVDYSLADNRLQEALRHFDANRERRDSGKLDWVVLKEMAEEALDMAYAAEAEPLIQRIRQRVAKYGKVAQETTEAQIVFRLRYIEGGKRNYELRNLDRDLKAMGYFLPGEKTKTPR